jgi:transcriptional regulator with XRE-family HTH domain
MTSNLLKATLLLLNTLDPKAYPDLAKSLGVSPLWLAKLKSGEIKEPGVNKIEKLYNELSGTTLSI